MSKSKTSKHLGHFSHLNQAVYDHEPIITASTSLPSANAPDLILLITWMDASLRNIAKYTTGYAKLYPSARILLITTSSIDAAFISWIMNRNRIAPVLEVLYALPSDAKFLLHLFSNGGAFTAAFIADTYQKEVGRPLPVTALVLDSAPGKATYEDTVRAFAVSLPKNIILRFLGVALLKFFYGLYQLVCLLSRQEDMVERARKVLNSKSLFDVKTPRMYIYSVNDEMVPWQYVEEHAAEAEKLGYAVDKEKFVDSGHAAHLVSDEMRYWDAVKSLWSSV
jgi:pimeloyl-ACP methyl ester carboxylesterase